MGVSAAGLAQAQAQAAAGGAFIAFNDFDTDDQKWYSITGYSTVSGLPDREPVQDVEFKYLVDLYNAITLPNIISPQAFSPLDINVESTWSLVATGQTPPDGVSGINSDGHFYTGANNAGKYKNFSHKIDLRAFGLKDSNTGDENKDILLAALTAHDTVYFGKNNIDITTFEIPDDKELHFDGSTIQMSNWLRRGNNTLFENGVLNFTRGGVLCDGKNNLTDIKLTVRTSTIHNANAAAYLNGSGVTQIDCDLSSPTRSGLVVQNTSNVRVDGGKYDNNAFRGISIDGGQNFSINPDSASYSASFAGIEVARCSDVRILGGAYDGNGEHGINFQGSEDIRVSQHVRARNNASGGVNFQEDTPNSLPTKNAVFSGTYTGNQVGVRFIEENINIRSLGGLVSTGNSVANIRLLDFGGSGREPDGVHIVGADIAATTGESFLIRSVPGKNINISEKHNRIRSNPAEIEAAATVAIVSSVLKVEGQHSVVLVTGGGTIENIDGNQLHGRILRLVAENSDFTIAHNSTLGSFTKLLTGCKNDIIIKTGSYIEIMYVNSIGAYVETASTYSRKTFDANGSVRGTTLTSAINTAFIPANYDAGTDLTVENVGSTPNGEVMFMKRGTAADNTTPAWVEIS